MLAHALLKNGPERGEVVMMYAARSVETVVCVKDILKAGRMFPSLVSPSLDCDFQKFDIWQMPHTSRTDKQSPSPCLQPKPSSYPWLETCHPTVSEYIEKELSLRVLIPAIALTPNGTTGTKPDSDEADILEQYQQYGQTSAGVVLGFDSSATLSFTSDIPKGVKCRHFSFDLFLPVDVAEMRHQQGLEAYYVEWDST